MTLFKIFLLAVTLSGCALTYSNGNSSDIPDFESLVGRGTLETSGAGVIPENTEAWLSYNDNYTVVGKANCEALILTSTERPILAVAKCDKGNEYFICGRAPEECNIFYETKHSNNTLSLTKDLGFGEDDIKLLVDFHKDKIVYRIQGQSCLIGYPHGCIISGFSWVDEDIYTFIKQ